MSEKNTDRAWLYVLEMRPHCGPTHPAPLVKVGIAKDIEKRMRQHLDSFEVASVHHEFMSYYRENCPAILSVSGNSTHELVLIHARQYISRPVASLVERMIISALARSEIRPWSGMEWFRPADTSRFWLAVSSVSDETDEQNHRLITYRDGRPLVAISSTRSDLELYP